MKIWTKRALTILAAVGLSVALLGAAQGTQTDPLVTMSYINDVAAPQILKNVDAKLDTREQALMDKLNAAIAQYEKEMEAKLSGSSATGTMSSAAFAVVSVPGGKQLIGSAGCELLLRSGTATAVAASAPGLIDTTSGATLPAGGALESNHLYMTTADGRGLKAVADVTVMVRGSYTIS